VQPLVREFGGNIYTVASGENITFMCTAEGAPLPTMVWIRDNQFLQTELSNRFQVVEETVQSVRSDVQYARRSILTLSNLTVTDSGFYTCRASNGYRVPSFLTQPYQLIVRPGM